MPHRKKLIPLKILPAVLELAIGRLEDKGVHVRRNAIQLLNVLLQYNPYSPALRLSEFQQKLGEVQLQLAEFVRKRQDGEIQDDEGKNASPPLSSTVSSVLPVEPCNDILNFGVFCER